MGKLLVFKKKNPFALIDYLNNFIYYLTHADNVFHISLIIEHVNVTLRN